MVAYVKVIGTDQFQRLARDLKRAGRGDLVRELAKSMRTASRPVVDLAKSNVLGVGTSSSRGGASARAARAAHLLRRRKSPTGRAKLLAHRRSGLRSAVARTVSVQVRAGGKSASVRIRSNTSLMPVDQRKLPRHMNTGKWRHPVFGNREAWVTQTVSPNQWFDRAMREGGPRVHAKAIDTVSRYLEKLG